MTRTQSNPFTIVNRVCTRLVEEGSVRAVMLCKADGTLVTARCSAPADLVGLDESMRAMHELEAEIGTAGPRLRHSDGSADSPVWTLAFESRGLPPLQRRRIVVGEHSYFLYASLEAAGIERATALLQRAAAEIADAAGALP